MKQQMQQVVKNMTANMRNRLRMMVATGLVKLIYPEAEGHQQLQVGLLADELRDKLEHYQPYGLSTHPKADADALVLFPDGDRSNGVVIMVADKRYRLALKKGEVALHDDIGQSVHLTRTGIDINTTKQVNINTPKTYINGTLIIDGQEFFAHKHSGVKSGPNKSGGVSR